MSVRKLSWLTLLLAAVVAAQEYRGRVQGLVTDPSQAAIVGAKVTLRNVNTGVETTRETDAIGRYLFDFVQPGAYTLAVEAAGFNRFVQENITVLTRGDVTVNVQLTVGALSEQITVTEVVTGVQFNTGTMSTTVQGNMLRDIPILARNPFTLALLNPAVINRYWDIAHRNPFYMWSSNGLDVGGRTGGKNDMLLDGAALGVSARGSYMPSMDGVQEVVVHQNAVDAEYGFSAGGVLNVSMKSGTNDYHGTAYYFGRNPKLNAVTNRITRGFSVVRNHIWGGTVGGPILKNRMFFYQTYEQWRSTQPQTRTYTLPTDLERTGDFSRSLTPAGALRVIYDPFTTKFDPATATVSRQPFPGNILPRNRMDPTGQKIMNDLWKPNNPGNDPSGIDNYKATYAWWLKYWNISNRVDFNISDKWRMYTRFSKYETRLDNPNHGGTIAVRSDNGGLMDALNAVADALYMASPSTVVNMRYGAVYVEDDYDSQWAKVPDSVWANLWPNGWYKPILSPLPGVYYPAFNFSGNGSVSAGIASWWLVRGRSHNGNLNVTHDRGIHHMKVGWMLRYQYDQNGSPGPGSFTFHAIDTGDNFLKFNAKESGNMFASALLGVVNSGNARIMPMVDSHQQMWAFFFQDDIKLTRRITLNLGIRYELETAPSEYHRMYSRYLDLSDPIPELANNPPKMPDDVLAIARIPYKWTGAWIFTDDKHPGVFNSQKNVFLPRVGAAFRMDDSTALRVGFARYSVPWVTIYPETNYWPKDGFSRTTTALGPIEGVPRTRISDPFPSGTNPLLLPVGKSLGRYTNLGDSVTFFPQNMIHPINDRYNLTLSRQLPMRVLAEATYFMSLGRNVQDASMWGGDYTYNLNMVDPNYSYTYKGATTKAVPNPFYRLLPADKMPGVLRNQPTVSVGSLLRTYPHYGTITERFLRGKDNHYHSFQFKAERPMAQGIAFTFGYNYSREARGEFFNDIDTYNRKFTMIDTREPRHHIRLAGTWELPFGRGRRFGADVNRWVDALIGGWATSHIFLWNNGPRLSFGQMICDGNPKLDKPTLSRWFDTSKCRQAEPYTPRTNPWYFDDLRGPGFWNWDATAVKYFRISERVRFELRMEFFNFPNVFMPGQPTTSVTSANFGKSTTMAGGNYGREVQYTGRIHF